LFECDRDEAENVGEHVAKVMEEVALEYFTDYVRFPCDVGFGNTWGDIA
jgi:DNA polymerase I-like protein with 3'-5' exonuclease and polymerase domains